MTLSDKRKASIRIVEGLMLNTHFPKPIRGHDLKSTLDVVGIKFRDDADISSDQLAEIWLRLAAPSRPSNDVALIGFIGYLALMIRLTRSFLAGQVASWIFAMLIFDWTRTCSQFGSKSGFRLGQRLDHLVDLADRYPELEAEKQAEGMLDDSALHNLAKSILEELSGIWTDTTSRVSTEES